MKGWYWLAAFVAGYDAFAALTDRSTLSAEYGAAVRHHPVTVNLVTAYILLHLYGALPRHLDPLRSLGHTVQERRGARPNA